MPDLNIIQLPISELYCGHRFEWQCQQMGFGTLEEILVLGPEELAARPGFSYTWLGELSGLLADHGLLHLLQPIPGRKYC